MTNEVDTNPSAVMHDIALGAHWPATIGCCLVAALGLLIAAVGKPMTQIPLAVPVYQMSLWCFFVHTVVQAFALRAALPCLTHAHKCKASMLAALHSVVALSLLVQRYLGRLAYEHKFAVTDGLIFVQGDGCVPPMQDVNLVLLIIASLLRRRGELSRSIVLGILLLLCIALLATNISCSLGSLSVALAVGYLAGTLSVLTKNQRETIFQHQRVVAVDRLTQRFMFYDNSNGSVNIGVDFAGCVAFIAVAVNVSMSLKMITAPNALLFAQFVLAVGKPCWMVYICSVLRQAWEGSPAKTQHKIAVLKWLGVIAYHLTVAAHVEAFTPIFHTTV